ncbi:MAG: type II secretion system protein [Acidobacteria bacterium]|nr:type II secretion system protein [Acidobacteriota bacterium]
MNRRGFTLLEVLVATVIMAIAVGGLLSSLSTSMRNASRLTAYDRAAMLARHKMDELLATRPLPMMATIEGQWPEMEAGWRARMTPFDFPPGAGPQTPVLERIELEVWWMQGREHRTFTLDAFRRSPLTEKAIAAGGLETQ